MLKRKYLPIISCVFYEPCKYTYHAEQLCIKKCKNKAIIKHCTLILVRLGNAHECSPCKMCSHIMNKYKLANIKCYIVN